MIRVERPPEPPDVLQDAGARETRKTCDGYDLHPEEYRSGAKKFTFKDGVYNHRSVKDALVDAQHRKCCYCESSFLGTSWGTVEHFRPKRAIRNGPGRALEYPGYYWLAFHWENLLVSCERCNTIKGSLFPLSDPGLRARCHRDEVDKEEPLLVDPAREDPRQHIRFRGAAVEPLTPRGRETIKSMGLQREDLEEKRGQMLQIVRTPSEHPPVRRRGRGYLGRIGSGCSRVSWRRSSPTSPVQRNGPRFSRFMPRHRWR